MRKKRKVTMTTIAKKWFLLLAITAGLVTSCKDYDDDIDGLNEDIAAIESSLTSQQSAISAVQSSITTQIASLKTQLEAAIASGDAAAASSAAAALAKATAVETAVNALTDDVEDLQTQLAEKASNDDLEAVEVMVGELATDIVAINAAIETIPADLEAIEFRLDAIDGEDGKLAQLQVLIGIQEDALEAYKELVDGQLADLLGDVEATIDDILGDIEELQNSTVSLTAFENAVEEINEKIGGINTSLAFIYSNMVTGIQSIPLYTTSDGHPLIYAPILQSGSNKYASNAQLSYQVNPSSVSRAAFEIKGLVKKSAIVTKAAGYIAVSESAYQGGVLSLNANLAEAAAGQLDFYALVVQNLKEGDATERLVTSDYVVADQPVVNATDVTISKVAPTYTSLSANLPTPTTDADWMVVFNNASGVAMDVTSYFVRAISSTKVQLKDLFNVTYKYELATGWAGNAYFEIPDQNASIIKVKAAAAAAVGQKAKVTVSLLVNNAAVKTATIYVDAVDRIPTETTVINEEVSYVRGNTDITGASFSEDLLINAIGNVGLSYTSVTFASTLPAGITFDGTDALGTAQTRTLKILNSVAAGTYNATLTYTTADGSKWHVKYKITVTDGAVNFDPLKVTSYWDEALNTMFVYGKQVGAAWSLEGDLNDGFGAFATLIPAPAPSTGGALTYSSHSYAVTGTHPATITGTVIKLTGSYGTYVNGTKVPVKLSVTYSNGKVYTHDFNVQFKNPIQIEYRSTLDVLNQQFGNFTYYTGLFSSTNVPDYTGKSPWSGIKVTNLATGLEVTDYDGLSVLLNIGTITQTPSVTSNLGFNWNRWRTDWLPAQYTLGYMTWDYTGTVLTAPLNVNCNITYTTTWGQSFTTTDSPLKVTVTQPEP